MTFSVYSDRAAPGIVVLREVTSNLDGGQDITSGLPAGFGDLIVLDVFYLVQEIATIMSNPELQGPRCQVSENAGGQFVDFVGNGRWVRHDSAAGQVRMSCWIHPRQPTFVRETESLLSEFSEVDTNATPTADLYLYVRGRRLRDVTARERALVLQERFGA